MGCVGFSWPSSSLPWCGLARYVLLNADIIGDPYPSYERLRAESPVHWDRRFGWIISRYADVAAAVRDTRLSAQRPLPGGSHSATPPAHRRQGPRRPPAAVQVVVWQRSSAPYPVA